MGFLGEDVHFLGFHYHYDCCNDHDHDHGNYDGDDDEKIFTSSASTTTAIAAMAFVGQLIWSNWSKIMVNLLILAVCVIILMMNLSTDEVAARSGWVTMSTRLCDSCKVD